MTAGNDADTARAFATSWNHVGERPVYSWEQFLDWMAPLGPQDVVGQEVLELGFGNGSHLYHMGHCGPRRLCGVELADTLETARRILRHLPPGLVELHRGDLTQVDLGQFDLVYCIGVLHHLQDPYAGFQAVLRHTRPGGRFHCWVYAREGNDVILRLVEPMRRMACRLPWWLTKYGLALPLVCPFYVYARGLARLARWAPARAERLPLGRYSLWIAPRPFWFFHHVAFDQLVSPRTVYLDRATLESWLRHPEVEPGSSYLILRNGNSWKFGGQRRLA